MFLPLLIASLVLPGSSAGNGSTASAGDEVAGARLERVPDFRRYAQRETVLPETELVLERVTTAVPWPRGLIVVGDELVVLARGRHRNAGGIDPTIPDKCGALFSVDPDVFERVIRSEEAGDAVRANASVLVEPDPSVHRLYDPSLGEPIEANLIDRPYCTLAYDEVSDNFIVCGYSGVDLPGKRFRKNATDSILRFDRRDGGWHVIEQHDPSVVPVSELDYVVPDIYYPHHDPAKNPAPHGWLNGPDGAAIAGRYLYAVGKDNHLIATYDLEEIRRSPKAGPPESAVALEREVNVRIGDRVRHIEALGASALAANDGWLYVGYRTSSVVLRFPLDAEGALVQPVVGELIAVFSPWDPEKQQSANLIDLAFDSQGQLYVACAQKGRVWNVGVPDPENVFDGCDLEEDETVNEPYVDLRVFTGNARARTGNITFDENDRLYICSGNYDSGTSLAGVIYRAVRIDDTSK